MPASAPAAASSTATLRSHGEVFVRADLKNRMEKVRLDKQLKVFDRDQARHKHHIDRQMRTLVTRWHGVSMTTGHSDQALPPDGPQDNVYDKCKHSKNKLSEKRLMEWKVRERQLEKFLRQFQPRPRTTPCGMKPRPSSSHPALKPQSDVMLQKGRGAERRRSVHSACGDEASAARRRSASAVSFASRTEVIYHGDEDERLSTAGEEQRDEEEGDGSRIHLFQSGLRSVSTGSFNQYYDLGKRIVSTPLKNIRNTDDFTDMSEIPEETKNSPPFGAPPSASQVAENLRTSTKDYKAFVRARSFTDTKFFVTKDNVLMTDPLQQTYRRLQGNNGSDSSVENVAKPEDGQLLDTLSDERAPSRSDVMSVSSYSSDDLAESVFVLPTEGAQDDGRDEGISDSSLAVIDIEDVSNCGEDSIAEKESGKGDSVREESTKKTEHKCEHDCDGSGEPPKNWTTDNPTDRNSLSCESAIAELALEDYKKGIVPQRAASVSAPVKKLTIVEQNEQAVPKEEAEPSPRVVSGRRHSFSPLSGHRAATSHCTESRRHSLFVGKDSAAQRTPKALLLKRRKTSAALLRTNQAPSEAEKRNTSALTSAMTVTPLLTSKDSQPGNMASHKHIEDSSDSLKPMQLRHHQAPIIVKEEKPFLNPSHNFRHRNLSRSATQNSFPEDSDDESVPNTGEERQPGQWRRDLALEQPAGLRPSVSSLGTVIKAAMVFSKAARRRALSTMVEENNTDTREAIRKERLRKLQSRATVLSKIVAQFPVNGD